MKAIKFIGLAVLGLFVLTAALLVFFERVEPYEIGVRVDRWGEGVRPHDFDAGFHLGVPGLHEWHRLDRRTHFITFSEPAGFTAQRGENSMERPPLEIRTQDNPASVDVTVTYRIKPGEAHLLVAKGLKTNYRDRVISTVIRVLREELAQLTPHQFVTTDLRLQRSDEALAELRLALNEYHVEPESLLIRAVRFPETYEAKLQETQLRPQLAQLERAKRMVEDALGSTGRIEKETERMEKEKSGEWDKKLQEHLSRNQVAIAEILGEAKKYDLRLRAEADASHRTMLAAGDLALAEAEALRDELRNSALDTAGGRILQARTAAENLHFESVTLNSNDPSVPSVIDIDALVRLLVGAGSDPSAKD